MPPLRTVKSSARAHPVNQGEARKRRTIYTRAYKAARGLSLLQLPREIRDLIYEYLLGPDVISIEFAVAKVKLDIRAGDFGLAEADKLYKTYKLVAPLEHRTTFAMPLLDVDTTTNLGILDSSTVFATYQLDSRIRGTSQAPQLQLVRVCKQMHAEFTEQFYDRKTFSFLSPASVQTATAFLGDISSQALGSIRSIEVFLSEVLYHEDTARDINHVQNAPDVYLKGNDHLPKLCELLASCKMRVRKLSLQIESKAYNFTPYSLPTIERLEKGDFGLEFLDEFEIDDEDAIWFRHKSDITAPWITPLLNVRGLEQVSVSWMLTSPTVQRELNTVLQMRQHMLKGANQSQSLSELGFTELLMENDKPQCSDVCYNPVTTSFQWQDHQQTEIEGDPAFPYTAKHPAVCRLLLHYKAIRVCHFELAASDK